MVKRTKKGGGRIVLSKDIILRQKLENVLFRQQGAPDFS